MPDFQTLPELQQHLDRMRAGEAVFVSRKDFKRFFGEDDAALGRLQNFADGHNCLAVWTRSDLKLIKNPQPRPNKAARLDAGQSNFWSRCALLGTSP